MCSGESILIQNIFKKKKTKQTEAFHEKKKIHYLVKNSY